MAHLVDLPCFSIVIFHRKLRFSRGNCSQRFFDLWLWLDVQASTVAFPVYENRWPENHGESVHHDFPHFLTAFGRTHVVKSARATPLRKALGITDADWQATKKIWECGSMMLLALSVVAPRQVPKMELVKPPKLGVKHQRKWWNFTQNGSHWSECF